MSKGPGKRPGVGRRLAAAAARPLFRAACAVGRPFGGIRPRRIYDWLGRLAHPVAEFDWRRNRWGDELYLSPHYHIDRNILIFGTYDAARYTANHIPGARFVGYPSGGHLWVGHQQEVTREITQFLKRHLS